MTFEVDGVVSGTAATIGRASDSSMIDSSVSPISLDTGNVDLAAGRRMRGWDKARTESLEVVILSGMGQTTRIERYRIP